MSNVIVMGSSNTDLSIKAEHLPKPGETVTDGEFMVSYGGKGANQALAALKADATVTFLSKIGTDAYGNLLYSHLVKSGLAPEGLLRDQDSPSGVALIAIDQAGSNQIIVAPGSNKRFTVEDLSTLAHLFEDASIFLAQLEIPLPR